MSKSNKGITLVALVVTIVVLIILAGVSLTLVLGQQGIVNRSTAGKVNYTNATLEEQNTLNSLDTQINTQLK